MAAAYLSYRFVEQPFRDKRFTRKMLFRTSLGTAAILISVSVGLVASKGVPRRFPAKAVSASRYLEFDPKPFFREGPCFVTQQTKYSEFKQDECLRINGSQPNYLLLGDSHAAQYWYEMKGLVPSINVLQATATGCKPFLASRKGDYNDCRQLIDFMYGTFLLQHPLNAVIISARWGPEDLESLRSTLIYLRSRGIHVILVGPSMEYAQALPRLIALSIVGGDPWTVYSEQVDEKLKLDPQMEILAKESGAEYLSLIRLFCKSPQCEYTTQSGAPLLFDHDHLSLDGSSAVIQEWKAMGVFK